MYMDKHLPYILAFADIQKIHVVLDMIIKQLIREVEQVTERLTQKPDEGILVKESHGENVIKTLYQCYGAEPLPDYSNCDEGYLAMEKLLEYESAEEDGRLVVLPCVVGDILHKLTRDFISEYRVVFIEISTGGNLFFHTKLIKGINDTGEIFSEDMIEKTIFLTKEAAEKALKEMERK